MRGLPLASQRWEGFCEMSADFKATAKAYDRLLKREQELSRARPEDAEHLAQLALGDACRVLQGLRDQTELKAGWELAKSKSKEFARLLSSPNEMDGFLDAESGLLIHIGLTNEAATATIAECKASFAKVRDRITVQNLNPTEWEQVFGVVMRLTCEFGVEEQRKFGFRRILRYAVVVAGASVLIIANVSAVGGAAALIGIPSPSLVEVSVFLGGVAYDELRRQVL